MVKIVIYIKSIVKNKLNETIGYDIIDKSTNREYKNVNINELKNAKFENAQFINGKYPYIRGNSKLQIRIEDATITVYHGSCNIIKEPKYMGGKSNNDYGNGFYTTMYAERADEWALLMNRTNKAEAYNNKYEINLDGLNILDLDEYGPLAWIAEVIKNRGTGYGVVYPELFIKKYSIDTSAADIIVGYRADDSYFRIIEAFINGTITMEEVVGFFYKAKLGKQVFLKSRKAFDARHLKFISASKVPSNKMQYAINNDSLARKTVNDIINKRINDMYAGYKPTGLMFMDAVQHNYKYNKKDGKYYE